MSEEFTPSPPQHDRLPSKRILGLGIGWLVLVGLVLLGVRWWEVRSEPKAKAPRPARMGESEISIVNQRPFELEDQAPRLRAEQGARLESYGWVDRSAGVIHVPIERAMEQVLVREGRAP
jgi:hypothetical protein